MGLLHIDHINVCTANLAALEEFYRDVLEMRAGPRPNFSFNGAWMYCGDKPCIHLVERLDLRPPESGDLQLQHFAFRAANLEQFLERLRERGVPYRVGIVEDFETCQINVFDPDGNHIHVDFPLAEARRLGLDASPR